MSEDVALRAYSKLFRVAARFYSDEAIVIIDHMVAAKTGCMSAQDFAEKLKMPEKTVAQALAAMVEHGYIISTEKPTEEKKNKRIWRLSDRIVPLLESRLKFIKLEIDKLRQKAKTPEYECKDCKKRLSAIEFAMCNDVCPQCRSRNLRKVEETLAETKPVLDEIDKILGWIEEAKKLNFPTSIYGKEYMKELEEEIRREMEKHDHEAGHHHKRIRHKPKVTHEDIVPQKPLHVLAIEKLKQKNMKLKFNSFEEIPKEEQEALHEYYSKNHTDLSKEKEDLAALLDKRRQSYSKLSDEEYEQIYRQYRSTKKVII